ncbi:uncharacterized protein LOC120173332 [Hibiscus syriacus]|uniref:uncharacterized protein LOC120173332 n=1 Tax=Hibiscus syriacus TaxID=106335 RepID=UPI001924C661|nr:uncharacterized protein LOC120173332 [Hibiscus syriacus]
MALLKKLPTKGQLLRMGISNDNTCVNCSNSYESRDHLFSQCTLAVDLWNLILKLNGMQSTFLPWDEMVTKVCSIWKGRLTATNGDPFLGGEDFHNARLEYLVRELNRADNIDLSKYKLAL